MAYVLADMFPPQFEDANGNPLVLGTIEFYIWNTPTPTPFYTDSIGTSGGTSCALGLIGQPINGGGASIQLFYDDAVVYKIVRKDAAGSVIAPTLGPFYPVPVTLASSISQLRADLASASNAALGAGLSGYAQTLTYAAATVGGRLNKLSIMATACGRLSNLITDGIGDPFTQCHFIPYNGCTILVNGVQEIIPYGVLAASGGINGNYQNCYVDKVPGQTLANNTIYFIYVAKISGTLILNFSTTGYYQNGITWGNAVKTDDPGSALVGICNIKYVDRGDGHGSVPTTFGGAHGQTIAGYFNRFRTSLFSQLTGGAVTSTTLAALPNGATVLGMPSSNYMEWVQWYDDAPTLYYNADSGNPTSVGALLTLDMGVNSTTAGYSPSHARAVTADQQCIPIPGRGKQVDATGHYYAQMLYKTSAGAAYFEGLCWADGIML